MNLGKDSKNDILYLSFNQDYGCFSCGTEKGFAIYNCDPLKERFRRGTPRVPRAPRPPGRQR